MSRRRPRSPLVHLLCAVLAACSVGLAASPAASAQATRTWVSGVGDDANPCSRTAPCKTLAGSISKTAARGEINSIDAGAYGAVVITKGITIDLDGFFAGILHPFTNGIVVNAGEEDDVVLRNFDMLGGSSAAAPPACEFGGLAGIRILKARSVRIEGVNLSQALRGIQVDPTAGSPDVFVNDVRFTSICDQAITSTPAAGADASIFVRDSTITASGTALRVADRAKLWMTGSTLFGNALAFEPVGTGEINLYDDNRIAGNTADGGPVTVLPSLAPPAPTTPVTPTPDVVTPPVVAPAPAPAVSAAAVPVPAPAQPTTVAAPQTPVAGCKVPNLKGKSRAGASSALKAAGCKLGSVTLKAGPAKSVGKVLTQKKKAGTALAAGAKVGVTIGRKR